MAFATQQNGLQTSVQSSRTAPFRSGPTPPRRVARVATTATQEPVSDVAKKAAAAVVAATLALSPMTASAASLGGVLDQAGAAKDQAAGAVKSATGNKVGGNAQGLSGAVKDAAASGKQGVKSAPSIGEALENAAGNVNPAAKRVAGSARQGARDLQNQPNVGFWGNAAGLQKSVGLPSADGLADKAKAAGDKVAGAAKDATGSASGPLQGAKGDAKSALGDAKQGVKNLKDQPNVGFWGDASSLQVNVDAAYGGGGSKQEGKAALAGDRATGAAKDLSDQTAGPKSNESGDAKTVEAAKRGIKNLKNQSTVGFGGNVLQMNVGLPSADGLADKAKAAGDKVAGAAKDATGSSSGPLQGAKGDAKSALGDAKQGLKNLKDQPNVGFWGDASSLQQNVDFPVTLPDKAKASKEKVAEGNKSSSDGGQRAGSDALQGAFDGAKKGAEKLSKGVRFTPAAAGLQQNVDFPVMLPDKAKASKEKVAEGNKSSSDGGQRAGADALQGAFDSAKQGAEKLKKGVRFNSSAAGLQQNVDFPVTLPQKAKASKEKVAEGNKSSSDGGQRAGADALQGAFDSAKQGADKLKKGVRFNGGAAGLQQNVDFPVTLPEKAQASKEKLAEGNKSSSDGGQRAGADALQGAFGGVKDAASGAKQGAKNLKNQAGVAFSGASGLQVDVGLPSADGLADKAKAAGDKVAGAAKDATGSGSGPLQGAKGDAKSALGDAKQGLKDLKSQPNVGFSSDAAGLQHNIGQTVFGRGEVGTTKDQTFDAINEAKDNVQNPVQSTKNALDRTGQEANRVLSNPTGGPEQSKRAAQQLEDANAEIPKALAGGAQKIKDSVASPASFSDFGTATLQRGAALEA